jgi:hypothetical protein
MQEATVSPLLAWENFYVIVGSSAAALTGLMFVVITLIASRQERRPSGSVAAFGTPNVVHFCAALFIAAILSAPWPELWCVGLVLGLCGLGGVGYVVIVLRRTLRQAEYQPVLEGWLGHIVLPFVCYATLCVAGVLLLSNPVPALFAVGAVTILLLFIGIHNAWDTLTYLTLEYFQPTQAENEHPD